MALGYNGPILCTAATADLLVVMLADAAYIEEQEATLGKQTGKRHEPLYAVRQAELVSKQVKTTQYDTNMAPYDNVRCVFRDAGQFPCSSVLEVWVDEQGKRRKLVFSGDIGQAGHLIADDPAQVGSADVLVTESTFGNRLHKSMPDSFEALARAITDAVGRKHGNVIVPAFAVGRAQDLVYLLHAYAANSASRI